jgi:hypothetical protein
VTQEQSAGIWVRHRFAVQALRHVLGAFEPHGVSVLPVKGIILAHTLYEDTVERPMVDVDLRLRPADLRKAAGIAKEQGWDVKITSKQLGTFELTVDGTLVEVETTIGPPGVCAVTVDQMLARSVERTEPLGFAHREPEIHDHALLLCVNAFKDKLPTAMPWASTDLARIAALPDFDPDAMAQRAREARLAGMVWLVAEWVEKQTGAGGAWEIVRARLGKTPPRPLYARALRAVGRPDPTPSWPSAVLVRACSDDVRRQAQALALGAMGTVQAWWRTKRGSAGA